MKLTGAYSVPGGRDHAYALLHDPAILAQCIPGCDGLEPIDENEYALRLKMALAGFAGQFDGKIRLTSHNPPESFRLIVEGSGKLGFVKGDGLITLTTDGSATAIKYEGELQVGGTIASFGQRLTESAARMAIKHFFDTLALYAAPHPATESAADD